MLPARERILTALNHEPFLTTNQVAKLFYPKKRNGDPSKVYSIRPRKTTIYELVPGYFNAYRILNRMAKDGVIAKHKPDFRGEPDMWSAPKRKALINWYSRNHEKDCADTFVALAKTKALEHWDAGWATEEEHFGKFKVNYDRRAEIEGVRPTIFIEVDRGTEDLETIRKKAEKYIRLANATKESFVVLFTVQKYRYGTIKDRADELCKVFHSFSRGNQFLVTPHIAFLDNPLGDVIIPPHHPNSLLSLTGLS